MGVTRFDPGTIVSDSCRKLPGLWSKNLNSSQEINEEGKEKEPADNDKLTDFPHM